MPRDYESRRAWHISGILKCQMKKRCLLGILGKMHILKTQHTQMCKCKSRHRSSAERLCCCLPTRLCRRPSAPPLRAEHRALLSFTFHFVGIKSPGGGGEAWPEPERLAPELSSELPQHPSQQWKLGAAVALKASLVLIWKLSFQERHPTGLYSCATWVIKKFIGESANFNNGL